MILFLSISRCFKNKIDLDKLYILFYTNNASNIILFVEYHEYATIERQQQQRISTLYSTAIASLLLKKTTINHNYYHRLVLDFCKGPRRRPGATIRERAIERLDDEKPVPNQFKRKTVCSGGDGDGDGENARLRAHVVLTHVRSHV
ncbi:hypothetical protein ALC56_06569 [Trachymyrmex septentrionalis]|uniref:Uncharacterized protein n=1 Tax=Trachymyrmex septentrionalis TaxID=34720 RepID=A0A195FFI2_9HYME|nr:hypothetical protein ALC56_06569 [Trachymyrmex septentrionalis]